MMLQLPSHFRRPDNQSLAASFFFPVSSICDCLWRFLTLFLISSVSIVVFFFFLLLTLYFHLSFPFLYYSSFSFSVPDVRDRLSVTFAYSGRALEEARWPFLPTRKKYMKNLTCSERCPDLQGVFTVEWRIMIITRFSKARFGSTSQLPVSPIRLPLRPTQLAHRPS